MGCTSSAPNTIPPNANKADKSIQFEEDSSAKPATEADVAGTEDENKANETIVLPTCDTLEQPVQLVRHNESTTSLQSGKVFHQNGKVIENENTTEPSETTLDEENKSKLEEIVDKVFDMNHIKEMNESDTTDCRINDEATDNKDNENDKSGTTSEPEAGDNPENYEENNKENSENAEEASPSQSQSSRATRWEALADIAAELPPSLAVDPLTGQIYALTK